RLYQMRLREVDCVDLDEVLWEATRFKPDRRSMLVYGYPRLSGDEAAFINASTDEESVLTLPYADHPLFIDNLETMRFFDKEGWRIDRKLKMERDRENLKKTLSESSDNADPFRSAIRDRQSKIDKSVQAHVYPNLEAEVRGVLHQVGALL